MNLKRLLRAHPGVRRIAVRLRSRLGCAYMIACHALLGVDRKKVYFSSFVGKSYSDSPRYICEALLAMDPTTRVVWHLSVNAAGRDRLPPQAKCVRPHSLSALRAMATAAVIVDNFNRPIYMPKFTDQYYVQTWHGDRGMKKILYDLDDGLDYPEGRLMDLAVAGSDFGEKLYRTAFHYEGRVLNVGMPRNDPLLNPDERLIDRVRDALKIPQDARVLLYAPTFRQQNIAKTAIANIELAPILAALEKNTGEKWICLARCHASNTGLTVENALDVSGYPEMAELLLISDMLITDYSSSVSDFMLLRRPILLYQPDRAEFERDDRTFYYDLDASPFPIAKSMDEAIALLQDLPALAAACPRLMEFFGVHESGTSARAVAEEILAHLEQ